MATSDDDTDEFTPPLPDDESPSSFLETRDTVTVEICPPFPPSSAAPLLTFDPTWRTEMVLALARGIDADSAFDRLPILADALEEAGCDHPQLLHHCRTCPHPFASCWVVNVVLDRVPGELPRVDTSDLTSTAPFPLITPQLGVSCEPRPPSKWGNTYRVLVIVFVTLTVLRGLYWLFTGTPPAPTIPRLNTFTAPTVSP